jgi:Ca-activated chloride channel family protein
VARLTALALGELPPEPASRLEAEIWRDAEARLEVEKTRAMAEKLTFAYAAEPPIGLTAPQQRAILERKPSLTGTEEKDARLTAYALGELRPSQAEVMSTRLADDRHATLGLEAVGALAARLRAEFAAEPALHLTLEQRNAILEHGRTLHTTAAAPTTSPATSPVSESGTTAAAPAAARARRWLPTAALAASFIALSYMASTGNWRPQSTATLPSTSPKSAPTPAYASFFPTPTPAPSQEHLIALLDLEKTRPAADTAFTNDREWAHLSDSQPPEEEPAAAMAVAAEAANVPFAASAADAPILATDAPILATDAPILATDAPMVAASAAEPTLAADAPVAMAARASSPTPQADALPLPSDDTLARSTPQMTAKMAPPMAMAASRFALTTPPATGDMPLAAGFLVTATTPGASLPTTLGRAGYDMVRQCVRDFDRAPPAALVRPEEIINQFDYDSRPAPGQDFAIAIEAATCPWNEAHQLVRLTVAAREETETRAPLRLTLFLRLAETPDSERAQLLIWQGLQALAPRLRPEDSISLVVWGRAHGVVLPPTSVARLENLREAPSRWHLGGPVLGTTDWATVEQTLLQQATDNSQNLCLILTDGPLDFTGRPPAEAAQQLRSMGAEMVVAEFGPRRPSSRAAMIADSIGATFYQADSGPEAARLLAQEALHRRTPLAEQVQLQVLFDPAAIAAWRPVGFGAGGRPETASHTHLQPWLSGRQMTAMYEVVPMESSHQLPPSTSFGSAALGGLRSGQAGAAVAGPQPPLSVSIRYRTPGSATRRTMTTDWTTSATEWRAASPDFRLATGAAAFALHLQADPTVSRLPLTLIHEWVQSAARENDEFGLRQEFASLIEAVNQLEQTR